MVAVKAKSVCIIRDWAKLNNTVHSVYIGSAVCAPQYNELALDCPQERLR